MQALLQANRRSFQCKTLFNLSQHNVHTKFAIVGGGSAGMNVAAQLLSSKTATPSDITVFDPSQIHYYQPGFTLIAGGVLGTDRYKLQNKLNRIIRKPMHKMFNSNIKLVPDSIGEYDPDHNKLYTTNGNEEYSYDILVVCSGIELRYDLIDGLTEALNDPQSAVGSAYKMEFALKINKLRSKFKGGKIIATQPQMPFKCGGAPQKWVYLTEHNLRLEGVKDDIESFKFYTHLNCMFGVKKYNKELIQLIKQKGVTPMYQTELVKVESSRNLAYFKNNVTGEIFSDSYDMMHVVPIQKANKSTASAAFSDANGYVDVNKYTLQSTTYENVFAVGDCNNCPNPKTAASIFAQTPTAIDNINKVLNKQKVVPSFNGYASCPILVGEKKVLLAEFIYNGVPHETFNAIGIDQAKPRRAWYHLKKDMFPFAYWNMAPKGIWYGTSCTFKPKLKPVLGVDIESSQIVKKEPQLK